LQKQHRMSFMVSPPVPSAGTVLPSDSWDWSLALSLVCYGTTSVTPVCLKLVRCEFRDCEQRPIAVLFQEKAIGPPLTPKVWAATCYLGNNPGTGKRSRLQLCKQGNSFVVSCHDVPLAPTFYFTGSS
jgi:hypothetical protein